MTDNIESNVKCNFNFLKCVLSFRYMAVIRLWDRNIRFFFITTFAFDFTFFFAKASAAVASRLHNNSWPSCVCVRIGNINRFEHCTQPWYNICGTYITVSERNVSLDWYVWLIHWTQIFFLWKAIWHTFIINVGCIYTE